VTPAYSIAEDDCLRTSTAAILDVDPTRVPHFVKRHGGNWYKHWAEWLAKHHRLFPRRIHFDRLADAPRGHWIAIVDYNPSDDCTHAIVMRGSKVAWDAVEYDKPKRHSYICGYVLEEF